MKFNFSEQLKASEKTTNTQVFRIGGYNLVLIAVVLAIAIAVNLFVSVLPISFTQLDMSSQKLYSISSNTKSVVNNLDEDVTIYLIAQAGKEDSVIEKLLDKYDTLSPHIKVEKKNPDIYPAFASQYTDAEIQNNDIIVESASKSRYISVDNIYEYDYVEAYVYGTSGNYFDGEGEITSAIQYVVSTELPKLYILDGHGETQLSDTIMAAIAKQNIEAETISLLNFDSVPSDATCVMLYAPSSDISVDEREMLEDYLDNGGHLFVCSGLQLDKNNLKNVNSILEKYGVTITDGVVIENDQSYYAFGMPFLLMPNLEDYDIIYTLKKENYHTIIAIAQGLEISSNLPEGVTVHRLMYTSDTSFSKPEGYAATTYDHEDKDIPGPFNLAVDITTKGGSEIVWVSSDYLLDDKYNSYSSGANLSFFTNAMATMAQLDTSIAIESKALNYEYLTIDESQALKLKIIMIGIIPSVVLIYGLFEIIKRRRLR